MIRAQRCWTTDRTPKVRHLATAHDGFHQTTDACRYVWHHHSLHSGVLEGSPARCRTDPVSGASAARNHGLTWHLDLLTSALRIDVIGSLATMTRPVIPKLRIAYIANLVTPLVRFWSRSPRLYRTGTVLWRPSPLRRPRHPQHSGAHPGCVGRYAAPATVTACQPTRRQTHPSRDQGKSGCTVAGPCGCPRLARHTGRVPAACRHVVGRTFPTHPGRAAARVSG